MKDRKPEELYSLVLREICYIDEDLHAIPIPSLRVKLGRNVSDPELLGLIGKLADKRVGAREKGRVRNVPFFRQLCLKKNSSDDHELAISLSKEALEYLSKAH